jgi:hypothetical protein
LQAGGHRFDPGTLHSAGKSGAFGAMTTFQRSLSSDERRRATPAMSVAAANRGAAADRGVSRDERLNPSNTSRIARTSRRCAGSRRRRPRAAAQHRQIPARLRSLCSDFAAVKRTQGHIPWINVDSRLRALREIWIATASPRGRPDAVPVWFWWDGNVAYFTSRARRKLGRRETSSMSRRSSSTMVWRRRNRHQRPRGTSHRTQRARARRRGVSCEVRRPALGR